MTRQHKLSEEEFLNIDFSEVHQQYSCVSEDYDGAPDSDFIIGWGNTPEEAIEDYLAQKGE